MQAAIRALERAVSHGRRVEHIRVSRIDRYVENCSSARKDRRPGNSPVDALPDRAIRQVVEDPGVNDAGAEILKQRGILSPEEIHRLAHKGKKAVCHSDIVKDADEAKLVQVNTLKLHGVAVNEKGL